MNKEILTAAPGRADGFARRLIWLRWWLLAALALALAAARWGFGIDLPVVWLAAVLLLLAAFNVAAQRRGATAPPAVATQLAVDVAGMGVLFFLSGGVANPLASLLLLPAAAAALTLPAPLVWLLATATALAYSLLLWQAPPLPLLDAQLAVRVHLLGMWLTFVISVALVCWLVLRMTATIRRRDAQLAAAREQALRDEQVMALGQLAAGAAHELGTPLATMQVLAEELAATALPQQAADVQLLRSRIAVCKQIIDGLTCRAGVQRAAPAAPLDAWLQGALARWQGRWPQARCEMTAAGEGPPPQLSAPALLEQALGNLLDNAARSSSAPLRLSLTWDARGWRVAVHDGGPGLPPQVLAVAGASPLPAQEAQGAGLGLWLTRAAVERLGGVLRLYNDAAGGVAVIDMSMADAGDGDDASDERCIAD